MATTVSELLLRQYGSLRWGEAGAAGLIAILVACRAFGRLGLYTLPVLNDPLAAVLRFAAGISAGGVVSAGVLALLHGFPVDWSCLGSYSSAWWLVSGAAILASRSAIAWRIHCHARADRLTQKVAIVGAGTAGEAALRMAARDAGVHIVGLYDNCVDGRSASHARGNLLDLLAYARHFPLDAVLIALDDEGGSRVPAIQTQLCGLPAAIYLVRQQSDSATAVEAEAFAGLPVLSLVATPLPAWHGVRKAVLDRVLGGLLLLVALPLMAVIAVVIRVNSRGPALFLQAREGLNGASFTMFKFRSMVHDRAADQSVQATRHDRRVTSVGSWLRRTSLDELPQLLNVVRGEMSLVGPRPHLATTCAGKRLFRDIVPNYAARHRVKPGLTGWAQVHGLRGETRTEQQIADRVAHDLYYINNWSLGLDLRILLRTLLQEVRSRSGNAY